MPVHTVYDAEGEPYEMRSERTFRRLDLSISDRALGPCVVTRLRKGRYQVARKEPAEGESHFVELVCHDDDAP